MSSRTFHLISANSTNLTQVGNTSAQLTGISLVNTSTTQPATLKIWWGNQNSPFSGSSDKPTVGTDIPAFGLTIPAAASAILPASINMTWAGDSGPRGNGLMFIALTQNLADADTTAVAAGVIGLNITWQ